MIKYPILWACLVFGSEVLSAKPHPKHFLRASALRTLCATALHRLNSPSPHSGKSLEEFTISDLIPALIPKEGNGEESASDLFLEKFTMVETAGARGFKGKLSTRKEINESGSEVIIQENIQGNQLQEKERTKIIQMLNAAIASPSLWQKSFAASNSDIMVQLNPDNRRYGEDFSDKIIKDAKKVYELKWPRIVLFPGSILYPLLKKIIISSPNRQNTGVLLMMGFFGLLPLYSGFLHQYFPNFIHDFPNFIHDFPNFIHVWVYYFFNGFAYLQIKDRMDDWFYKWVKPSFFIFNGDGQSSFSYWSLKINQDEFDLLQMIFERPPLEREAEEDSRVLKKDGVLSDVEQRRLRYASSTSDPYTLHIWVRQDTGNFELKVTK